MSNFYGKALSSRYWEFTPVVIGGLLRLFEDYDYELVDINPDIRLFSVPPPTPKPY